MSNLMRSAAAAQIRATQSAGVLPPSPVHDSDSDLTEDTMFLPHSFEGNDPTLTAFDDFRGDYLNRLLWVHDGSIKPDSPRNM